MRMITADSFHLTWQNLPRIRGQWFVFNRYSFSHEMEILAYRRVPQRISGHTLGLPVFLVSEERRMLHPIGSRSVAQAWHCRRKSDRQSTDQNNSTASHKVRQPESAPFCP